MAKKALIDQVAERLRDTFVERNTAVFLDPVTSRQPYPASRLEAIRTFTAYLPGDDGTLRAFIVNINERGA